MQCRHGVGRAQHRAAGFEHDVPAGGAAPGRRREADQARRLAAPAELRGGAGGNVAAGGDHARRDPRARAPRPCSGWSGRRSSRGRAGRRPASQAPRRADGSKPVVGSSRNSSSGSPTSARPTSSRRCCPPERHRRAARTARPARHRRACAGRARRRVVAGVSSSASRDRQQRGRRDVLEHHADARTPRAVARARVGAQHAHLARAAPAVALEDLDGRRLARAVGPQEREDLAGARLRGRSRARPRGRRRPCAAPRPR